MASRNSKLSLANRRRRQESSESDLYTVPETQMEGNNIEDDSEITDSDVTVDVNAERHGANREAALGDSPFHDTHKDNVPPQTPPPPYAEVGMILPAVLNDRELPDQDEQTETEMPQPPLQAWQEVPTDYGSTPPPQPKMKRNKPKIFPVDSSTPGPSMPTLEIATEVLDRRFANIFAGKSQVPTPVPSGESEFSTCLRDMAGDEGRRKALKEKAKEQKKVANLNKLNAKRGAFRPWRRFLKHNGKSSGNETQATIKGPFDHSSSDDSAISVPSASPLASHKKKTHHR